MNWREAPMARLLLPFLFGIMVECWVGMQQWVAPTFLMLLIVLLAYSRKRRTSYARRWWFGLLLQLFFFFLGFSLLAFHDERADPRHFARQASSGSVFLARAYSVEPTARKLRLLAAVQAIVDSSGALIPATGNLLAYIDIDASSRRLQPGSLALLQAPFQEIGPPLNPKAFDYGRYLHFQNIHYQAFVKSWEKVVQQPSLRSEAQRWRAHCLRILRKYLPTDNEYAVAAALTLGHKSSLPEEVRNAYSHTGAMHVLAVSGLHVGFIHMLAAFFLGLLPLPGRAWKLARTAAILAAIWGFALLTGASPSVMRAATMFSFLAVGQNLGRYTNIYNTLAASAFALLCIDPYLLFQVGFQLSYLAVLGIVYFQPKIYRLWYIENRLGDYLWKLAAVSLAAQATTLPLSLFYFHQFPVYFWLSGLVVVPAAALILTGALLLFALQALPLLAALAGKLLYGLVWGVNALIFLIQSLPGSLLDGAWVGKEGVILLYLALLGVAAAVESRRFLWVNFSLSALLAFTLIQSAGEWRAWQQQAIAVYHIPRGTALNLFVGKQALELRTEGVTEKQLSYAARQYCWFRRARDVRELPIDGRGEGPGWWYGQGFLQVGETRLAILREPGRYDPSGRLPLDVLLLSHADIADVKSVLEKFDCRQVVIDGSIPFWKARQWKAECEALGLPCHYTGDDGAWIAEL